MAKKKEDTIVDVAQAYSKTESFVNNNGKNISIAILIGILIGLAIFAVNKFYLEPQHFEAEEEMYKAEYWMSQGQDTLALNGDGEYLGLYDIADEYNGTPTADRANYLIGTYHLQNEEFDEAIEYLSLASFNDNITEAVRLGAIGDAMVELGDLEGGISQYEKAIDYSYNEFSAPMYLKKKGLCCEEIGNYSCALDAYKKIDLDFGTNTEGRDIGKYIARVEAKMAE
ncbi:MAG: hypothetical protein AAF487_09870 [Bacteroidota bacterium]